MGSPYSCNREQAQREASSDQAPYRSGAADDQTEHDLPDKIRKTNDPVFRSALPSSPSIPPRITSAQRNHRTNLFSTEFFNSLGESEPFSLSFQTAGMVRIPDIEKLARAFVQE